MLQQTKTLNDAEKNLWHQYSTVSQWSAVFIRNNYLINFIKKTSLKMFSQALINIFLLKKLRFPVHPAVIQ